MNVRLGIDAEALRRPLSGVGQYVFNLCAALEQELGDAEFFAYGRLSAEALAMPSTRWTVRQEPIAALRRVPSFVWLKVRGRKLCLEDRIDVFWAGRTVHPRLPSPIRTICTVHDLNHLLVPDTMQMSTRIMHRLWFAGDVRKADVVVANSQGTAHRVQRMLGRRVRDVLRPGLHPRFRPLSAAEQKDAERELNRLGIRRPYLLTVATLEPRKNVESLYEAFMLLKRRGLLLHHQLVLVGASGWQNKAVLRQLRRAKNAGVILPGYISDALLPAVYALADVMVFPSLYEGFGMPVLEARGCGTRTVIADVPELIEAGGPQAIIVQPTKIGIAEGIAKATRAPAQLPAEDLDLARRFTWTDAAHRLASLVTNP